VASGRGSRQLRLVALHESACRTSLPFRDVRAMSAIGGNSDDTLNLNSSESDPKPTIHGSFRVLDLFLCGAGTVLILIRPGCPNLPEPSVPIRRFAIGTSEKPS
jgi:hypothetical protein